MVKRFRGWNKNLTFLAYKRRKTFEIRRFRRFLVEISGIEPLTSWMPWTAQGQSGAEGGSPRKNSWFSTLFRLGVRERQLNCAYSVRLIGAFIIHCRGGLFKPRHDFFVLFFLNHTDQLVETCALRVGHFHCGLCGDLAGLPRGINLVPVGGECQCGSA